MAVTGPLEKENVGGRTAHRDLRHASGDSSLSEERAFVALMWGVYVFSVSQGHGSFQSRATQSGLFLENDSTKSCAENDEGLCVFKSSRCSRRKCSRPIINGKSTVAGDDGQCSSNNSFSFSLKL